jgi:hypothetical protein
MDTFRHASILVPSVASILLSTWVISRLPPITQSEHLTFLGLSASIGLAFYMGSAYLNF